VRVGRATIQRAATVFDPAEGCPALPSGGRIGTGKDPGPRVELRSALTSAPITFGSPWCRPLVVRSGLLGFPSPFVNVTLLSARVKCRAPGRTPAECQTWRGCAL